MNFIDRKIYHLTNIHILQCLCISWIVISLFGCNQASNNVTSKINIENGGVTLLWNEIPCAKAYNVYMDDSPGVTKKNGYKIHNVTNPVRINRLETDKTYYFVITVINEAGESKESKEESYYPIADKIGLIYWKHLFDKPIRNHTAKTDEKCQEYMDTPGRSGLNSEQLKLKSEMLSHGITEDKISLVDLAKEKLNSSKERMAVSVDTQENINKNLKSTTVPVELSTDLNLQASEAMRLKAAQMLSDSHFYIFFSKNSNELSPKAIEKLDRIYKILTSNSDANLILNGYSDSIGIPSINQMISDVRANSVKSYLSGKGVKPSRMTAFGHGAQNFLASNNSEEGRRLNRRVEIELIIP